MKDTTTTTTTGVVVTNPDYDPNVRANPYMGYLVLGAALVAILVSFYVNNES